MTEQMNISYDLADSLSIPQNIVEDYWLNVSGMFTNKIDALGEKYGLSSREITSQISSVYSYIDFGTCSACCDKNLEIVENRTKARQIIENIYYHYFCSSCRDKATEFCRNLSDGDKKNVWMKLCFKYKLWNKLNKDEMNFLKAIYYLRSWNRIYHEIIKLDLDNNFKLLFKLDKMHLIDYDKDETTGEIRIKMIKDLQNLIQQKQI